MSSVDPARDPARDIDALSRSGRVTLVSAVSLHPDRTQTSSVPTTPRLPASSAAADRALRILCRGYAAGWHQRRYALALWMLYGDGRVSRDPALSLAVALTVPETTLRDCMRSRPAVRRLTAVGVELIGRATAWYETADESPGCSGYFDQLLQDADKAIGRLSRARNG